MRSPPWRIPLSLRGFFGESANALRIVISICMVRKADRIRKCWRGKSLYDFRTHQNR